jgi:hypothetical protein
VREIPFNGLFEPWEVPTGDRRVFKAAGLRNRGLPIPLMMRTSSGGHEGAETIGWIDKIVNGPGGRWYSGKLADPEIVPLVKKAVYFIKNKVIRPSVDLDRSFTVEPRDHSDGKKIAYFTDGNVIGATLVPMPAFDEVNMKLTETVEIEPDEEQLVLVASIMTEFATTAAWDSLPIAPREYKFDADDAVKRIAAWAGVGTNKPDTEKYASMFLWRGGNQTGTTLAQEDFRLPLGDIGQDGQAYLVYHAIYAAAALLSGGHGGLPNIPDSDKQHIMGVINQIYPKMAQHFNDPNMKSPFMEGRPQQMSAESENLTERVEEQSEKFGVDVMEDNPDPTDYAGTTFATATAPSASDFANPSLKRATPLTVVGNRVFGHLGKWGECHLGIGDKCVMLPHSQTDYTLFKTGSIQLDDGSTVRVGKITVGTGHAHPKFGIVPSREHYDNSGWCAAVVNVGEDQFGVWVSGVLVDESKKAELMRSPLSGDWRRYNGNLELVAALAVNSPGFPVFAQEEGEEFSLVAAGSIPLIPEPAFIEVPSAFTAEFSYEEVVEQVRASVLAEQDRARRFAQIKADHERREQARRAARLAEFAPMPAPTTQQPAAQAPPAGQPQPGQQQPAAGQDLDGDGDPDADPSTPGIAEVDDPGRDTMLARMADSSYVVINEETGEEEEPGQFLYKQATESSQKAAQPAQQEGQPQAQAAQPQAAPQQQAQQAPPPQG